MDASIRQFIQELQTIQDGSVRAMMRFQLELAMAIRDEARENVKASFGKGRQGPGHPPKSDITERAYGSTARRSGRGGGLAMSGNIERGPGGSPTVAFGGPGVPYAAIQELGGEITPKTAQYLTIPFQPRYSGSRAREFLLRFATDAEWGAVLVDPEAQPDADGFFKESSIAYLLRRRVVLKPRPYLKPAVDTVTADPSVREKMRQLIGRTRLNVEVA